MKKFMFLILLLSVAGLANAVTVALTAVADSDIRDGTNLDYAKANRTELYLCNSPSGISEKAYIRFQLPSDVDTITSATLKLYAGTVSAAATTIYVNGLNDLVPFEDWGELSPGTYYGDPSGGLTWNNAPGNLTSSKNGFDTTKTTSLGTLPTTANAPVGTLYTFSSTALVDYLNADTNTLVNFLFGKLNSTSAVHSFASKEKGTVSGPVLEITYTPTPEPTTMLLLGIGSLLFARKRS